MPTLLFEHNVEHLIWKRLAQTERRPLAAGAPRARVAEDARRYEARACARASLTVAVSEADRAMLAELGSGRRASARCRPASTRRTSPARRRARDPAPARLHRARWTGTRTRTRCCTSSTPILPADPARGAGRVADRGRPEPSRAAARCGRGRRASRVTGTVDDVRPYVAEAAVCVVPLRVGGGTRLKIFEALAMGKAVVSTAVGAEGLPLVPGEHYLCGDEPADFARAVVALLRNPGGAAARRGGAHLVEERYSWATVTRAFEARIEEARRSGPPCHGRHRRFPPAPSCAATDGRGIDHARERVRTGLRGLCDRRLSRRGRGTRWSASTSTRDKVAHDQRGPLAHRGAGPRRCCSPRWSGRDGCAPRTRRMMPCRRRTSR